MNQGDAGSPSAYEWMTQAFQRPQPQQNGVLNALSHALHWAWYGNKPGAGLGAVPGQLASSFDPRSKAGLANLASMFVGGGPKGEDILNSEMPGQFEAYSTGKAAAGGHLASDRQTSDVRDALYAMRAMKQRQAEGQGIDKLPHMQADIANRLVRRAQQVHDALFGGEVHAKGPIPKRPDTTYTPSSKSQVFENGKYNNERMNAAVEKFNKTRETHGHNEFDAVAQQMKAEQDAAAAAKQRIIAKQLRNHGFSQHPAEHLHGALNERAQAASEGQGPLRDLISNTNFMRQNAHYVIGKDVQIGHNEPLMMHQIHGGYKEQMDRLVNKPRQQFLSASAARQSALARLLARQLHNHN